MAEPTPELIDQLYREEVLAARQMSPDEKLLAGPELFDFACDVTLDGIRAQHPDADDQQVREILRQRLALGMKLERRHDQ
ncbi:MAG: hypothetical protein ACE5GE_08795 [Phycisphaerae bacterium]